MKKMDNDIKHNSMETNFEKLYDITQKWAELSKTQGNVINTLIKEKFELMLENQKLKDELFRLKNENKISN
jgi:regulator of replication initiation timing